MSQTVQKNPSHTLSVTWERLIPKQMADDPTSRRIVEVHLSRYHTAAQYVGGKRVLDIASGAGYGTQLLGHASAQFVLGVDVCPQTVKYAQLHYAAPNVQFLCADAEQFRWESPFDVVVSFETIEHLQHPDRFVQNIYNLLVPGGMFLLSLPLGDTQHIDPYHLQALSQENVLELLEATGFSICRYERDDFCMSRSNLLALAKRYPAARPSTRHQLLTRLGWRLTRDFIFRGGVLFAQFFVICQRPLH